MLSPAANQNHKLSAFESYKTTIIIIIIIIIIKHTYIAQVRKGHKCAIYYRVTTFFNVGNFRKRAMTISV